jgi:SAM-dependent methyltransferase
MNRARLFRLLRDPWYTARLVAYKVYERLHPNEPWIAQGAVRYCQRELRPTMRAVETGSGRSTAWFARRVGHLTSVEHDPRWFDVVKKQIQPLANVDYRLVPLDHPEDLPTLPEYDPIPKYVAVFGEFADGSLDFVVVDGHYRQACVRAALPKLRSGGLLLIDNSNWLSREEWGVPNTWQVVHQSENVMGETRIFRKP